MVVVQPVRVVAVAAVVQLPSGMQLLGIEVWGWDRGGGNSKLVDVLRTVVLQYPSFLASYSKLATVF